MWCLLINYYEINGWIIIIITNLSNNFAHYSMKYFIYYSILLVTIEEQLQHITTHVFCSRSAVFEWVDITSSVACTVFYQKPLHWHHNERDGVSNHQHIDCLFNRLFIDQRKCQSPASLVHVRGIHRWPVNSLHKGPVALEIFPFDAIIMILRASASAPTLQITGKCIPKQKFHSWA